MELNKDNIVEIYPDPLILVQSTNSDYLESKLNFHNLTSEYVIFKLFNNKKSLYTTKPSTSFIPPKDTVSILIKRFKREKNISQIEIGKEKFLAIFHIINKVITSNEEAKEAFKSKIYKEDSEQKNMISLIIKEEEFQTKKKYNIDDLNDIGDDYKKGIEIYNDLNEDLQKEINKINENIREGENTLEKIKNGKKFLKEKENALKGYNNKQSKKGDNFNNILMICIILLGLMFGANLANVFNYLFHKTPNQKKREIVINQSENYVIKKIKELNENIINEEQIKNNFHKNNTNENVNLVENKETIENNNIIIDNTTNFENNKTVNEIDEDKIKNNTNDSNNNITENNKETKIKKDINNEIVKENQKEEKLKVNENNEGENIKKGSSNFLSFSSLFSIYLWFLEIII